MSDEFDASMFIQPGPLPEAKTVAVGGWTCECGALTWAKLTYSGACAIAPIVQCLKCGDSAEILALPAPPRS